MYLVSNEHGMISLNYISYSSLLYPRSHASQVCNERNVLNDSDPFAVTLSSWGRVNAVNA